MAMMCASPFVDSDKGSCAEYVFRQGGNILGPSTACAARCILWQSLQSRLRYVQLVYLIRISGWPLYGCSSLACLFRKSAAASLVAYCSAPIRNSEQLNECIYCIRK